MGFSAFVAKGNERDIGIGKGNATTGYAVVLAHPRIAVARDVISTSRERQNLIHDRRLEKSS